MTIWFAQNSSVDIDSASQWNDVAGGGGNVLTFALLAVGDILVANGKTSITINVDFTCQEITTGAMYGGTAGGGFTVASGRVITSAVSAGTTTCVSHSGTGTLTITGNVAGGGSSGYGVNNTTTGTINITGNVTAGSGATGWGVFNTGNGTINITGHVTGGSGGEGGFNQGGSGRIAVTGNVTGGSGAATYGIRNQSTGTVVVTGNVTGGSNATAYGINNIATGIVEIIGSIVFGVAPPLFATDAASRFFINGTIEADSNGRTIAGNGKFFVKEIVTQTVKMTSYGAAYVTGAARTLTTAGANQAATSDVRFGTSYGGGTGSLRVPDPAYVALGVLTDNTTGTYEPSGGASAADIADAVWDEARSGHTTLGTFGEKVAAELDSASIDAIWNEVLTGATHNIASSAGRRLRQLADTVVLVDGVCDAASNAGTDSTGTITLEVGTTTACVGQAIRCENQVRFIASYDVGTRVAQLDRPWCVVPDAGDEYVIFNVRNPLVGLASLALAGSTAAAVNDINAVTDKVDTGLVLDGVVYQFTENMLELGPSGGGGSTVNVLPATGIVANRTPGATLTPVVGETISQSITLYSTDGITPINLSGKTLVVVFETLAGTDVATVASANITITGANSNVVTFAYPSAVTASERTLRFAIRDAAAPLTMYLQGLCSVVRAPQVDP